MKMLLLNSSPVVSRLVGLSAKKMAYELDEKEQCDELDGYDIVVVDGDLQLNFDELKQKAKELIVLTNRDQILSSDIKTLRKPFLPTDFIKLLEGQNSHNFEFEEKEINNDEKNPYDDMVLNLDELNLDDEDEINLENEEVKNPELNLDEKESQTNDDNLNTLELDETNKENLEFSQNDENLSDKKEIQEEDNLDLNDECLDEDLTSEHINQNDENLDENLENSTDEISDESSQENWVEDVKDVENSENLESIKDAENLSDENSEINTLQTESLNENSQDDLENKPLELMYEKLSQDAKFIGDEEKELKEQKHEDDEFEPIVIENEQNSNSQNYEESSHEQIKKELADLNAMDEKNVDIQDELDLLKEEDIQSALGEVNVQVPMKGQNDEIMGELSQSIAGAITSSIKEDTLKAALKGMKMNINININFEDK